MTLIEDWDKIALKAWGQRLNYLAALLGAVEIVLPYFQDYVPRGPFAAAATIVSIAAAIARVVAQPKMHADA